MNKEKANKVWHGIFSPPCPRCGSSRSKPLERSGPVVMRGDEFFKRMKNRMAGKPEKLVQSWECLDCETKYDEEGHYIAYTK